MLRGPLSSFETCIRCCSENGVVLTAGGGDAFVLGLVDALIRCVCKLLHQFTQDECINVRRPLDMFTAQEDLQKEGRFVGVRTKEDSSPPSVRDDPSSGRRRGPLSGKETINGTLHSNTLEQFLLH